MLILFAMAAFLCAYVAFACAYGSMAPVSAMWKRVAKIGVAILHSALLWIDIKGLGGQGPSLFSSALPMGACVLPAILGFVLALSSRRKGSFRTMDRRQLELSPN